MAFSNQYALKVDIKKRLSSVVPTFKQGDNGVLKFQIFDDGRKYDLTDYTYSEITFTLPSGQSIVGNPILGVDGVLTYNFTGVEMSEVGKIETILSIYSASTMVSVQPFTCFIYDSMKGEDLSYIGILQDLIAEVQLLKQEVMDTVNSATKALDNANIIKQDVIDLNNKVNTEEQVRATNENNRKSNELTRINNESSRISEELKRNQNELVRESNEVNRTKSLNDMNTIISQFRNTGTYNSSTSYKKFNQVEVNGSTYIALVDNSNTPVTDTSTWRLLAKKGDKGDKGDTGAALSIQGKLTDASQLPPNGQAGQAYTVNGELYVWSDNTGDWENVGNIKGEKGDTGDKGNDGDSAYIIAVNNGFVGTSDEWLASLKGERGEIGKMTKYEYTIPATSEDQTTLEIPLPTLSIDDDVLLVLNNGVLYRDTDYTISGSTVTLKQPVVDYANATFFVRVLKNIPTGSEIPTADGSLLTDGSVSKQKLEQLVQDEINNSTVHKDKSLTSEDGVHSLRYFNGELAYKNDSDWEKIKTGNEVQNFPTGNVNDLIETGLFSTTNPTTERGFPRTIGLTALIKVYHNTDNSLVQELIFINGASSFKYFRTKSSTSWSDWVLIPSGLSNDLDSSSTELATTANAVKMVNDKLVGDKISIGTNASAGSVAVSIGLNSIATSNAVALGREAKATGNYFSVALGAYAEATGDISLALGYLAKSLNANTAVLGVGSASPSGLKIWQVPGSFSVTGTKNFEMPHPHPEKYHTHVIRHGAVESPTAGDTLYRYTVQAMKDCETLEVSLPDYFEHLNTNVDVWVNPHEHFGRAFGKVVGDKLYITCEVKGAYKALVIGTRNDNHESVQSWNIKGVEREIGESWNGETYSFEVDEITEITEFEEVLQ